GCRRPTVAGPRAAAAGRGSPALRPAGGQPGAAALTRPVARGNAATCAVSVFVPGTGNVMDSAGAPATYFVYASTAASGSPLSQFGIDQVHDQGRWVDAGGYQAPTGQLSVRLVTRGIDWDPDVPAPIWASPRYGSPVNDLLWTVIQRGCDASRGCGA